MNRIIQLLTVIALLPGAVLAAELNVEDAWVREAPHNIKTLAAYMTLHNTSDSEMVITAASSPQFNEVEFHVSISHNKNTMMRPIRAFKIPANKVEQLKPRGKHLMLIGAKQHLKSGDKVEITLELANGNKQTLSAAVRKGPADRRHRDNIDKPRHRDHHNHDKHNDHHHDH